MTEIYEMYPFEVELYIHLWEKQKETEREQNKDGGIGGALAAIAGMGG